MARKRTHIPPGWGRIVWSGDFRQVLIGPKRNIGGLCFIAEYPSAAAFVEMVIRSAYQEAVKHRQAAVLDSG